MTPARLAALREAERRGTRWAPIPDWPRYEVSDDGRVRNVLGAEKAQYELRGYRKVLLWRNSKHYTRQVHRLVLLAFIGPCPEGHEAAHVNGKPDDNRLDNLRWATHAENCADRDAHGTHLTGSRHPRAKLTEEIAEQIRARSRAEGIGSKALAREYGIAPSTMSRLLAGKSYPPRVKSAELEGREG